MKNLLTKIIALTILSTPLSSFADVAIAPISVKMRKNEKISSIKFNSNDNIAKTYQVSVYEVTKDKDGNEALNPSKRVKATPAVFKTKAGKHEQVIRVLVKKRSEDVEKYKVSIKEIDPIITRKQGATVNFVQDFRVPLIVD